MESRLRTAARSDQRSDAGARRSSAAHCSDHSIGRSISRSTPKPRGGRPSIAALASDGSRKAGDNDCRIERSLLASLGAIEAREEVGGRSRQVVISESWYKPLILWRATCVRYCERLPNQPSDQRWPARTAPCRPDSSDADRHRRWRRRAQRGNRKRPREPATTTSCDRARLGFRRSHLLLARRPPIGGVRRRPTE